MTDDDAYEAIKAAGFGLHTTWYLITGNTGGHRYAWRGAYRTRRHRTWVAVWAQIVEDGHAR